jgi:hypothetical protein
VIASGIILQAGVGIAVIGMALIVLGVIYGALFFPGLFVLTMGLVGVFVAAVLGVIRSEPGRSSE